MSDHTLADHPEFALCGLAGPAFLGAYVSKLLSTAWAVHQIRSIRVPADIVTPRLRRSVRTRSV